MLRVVVKGDRDKHLRITYVIIYDFQVFIVTRKRGRKTTKRENHPR